MPLSLHLGANRVGARGIEKMAAIRPTYFAVCEHWDALCADIIHAYQDNAIAEVLANA